MSDRKDARKVAAEKKKVVKKKVVRKPVVDSMKAPRGNPRRPAPDPKPRKTSAEAKDWAATKAIFLPNELTGKPKPEEKPKQAKRIVRVKPGTVARERLELSLGIGADDRKKWERQPDMTFEGVPKDIRERPGINRPRDYTRAEPNQRDDPRGVERIPLDVARDSLGRPMKTVSGDYYTGASGPDLFNIVKKVARATGGATYEAAATMGGLGTGPAGVELESTPETRKQAKIFLENVIGPETIAALSGEEFNKLLSTVELMLLPASIFSPLGKTAGTAILRGATRAPTIARAARSGVGTAAAADALSTPILSLPRRTFRAGDAIVDMASARSRTGRLIERGYDSARGRVSKVGIGPVRIKDETQKAGQVAQQRIKFDAKRQMVPAVRLKQIMGGLRKKLEYQYALRSLAMGIDPLEAAAYHAERAANATDPLVKANHTLHMDGYKRAAKYILRRGDDLMLVDNAPVKLRTAWRLVPEVAEAREKMLLEMGLLTEEQIAARIQNPGRVFKGAKWTPEEEHAMNVIRSSPVRQQLKDSLETQMSARSADAILRTTDEQARAAWGARVDELKRIQKSTQKKIEALQDAEAAGDEIDEVLLRQHEELLEEVTDELEAGVPYDWLYRRGQFHAGHNDRVKSLHERYRPGEVIHYKTDRPARVDEQGLSPEHQATLRALDDAWSKLDDAESAWVAAGKTKDGDIYKARMSAKAEYDRRRVEELHQRLWDSRTVGVDDAAHRADRKAVMRSLWKKLGSRKGALPKRFQDDQHALEMFNFLDELTEKGKAGRFWYRDSAKAILRQFNGDKKMAAKFAQLIAIYSPQKAVIPNYGAAMEALEAWSAGREITNGLPWQKRASQEVLDETGAWDGRKTNNFYRNLLQHIDRKKFKAEGFTGNEVTSDMWMARAFGYLTDTVSEGRYDLIESVVQQIAKERGWKPQEVQAAIWGAIKDADVDDLSANVDFAEAAQRNMHTVNLEVTRGKSGIGSDLSFEETAAVSRMLFSAINDVAEQLELTVRNVDLTTGDASSFRVGPAGYAGDQNAAVYFEVTGRPENVQRFVNVLSDGFDQYDVWATRPGTTGGARPTMIIRHSDLTDPDVVSKFFASLREQLGDRAPGFAMTRNSDGISVIAPGTVSKKGLQALEDEFAPAIKKAARDAGLGGRIRYTASQTSVIKRKVAKDVGDGAGGSVRAGVRGVGGATGGRSLDDSLAAGLRAELDRAVEDVRAARGGVDAKGSVLDESGWRRDPGVGGRPPAFPRTPEQRDLAIDPSVPREVGGFLHGVHVGIGDQSLVSVSERSRIPTETWVHELGHFWQHHFPGATRKLKNLLGDNKEDWVENWIEYVTHAYPQRNLPKKVRDAFDDLSEELINEARRTGGAQFVFHGMPREVAEVFDSTLWYRELKGGAIRGAEDFAAGVAYTLFELGLPRDLRHPFASHRSYVRSMIGLFGGKTIKKGFVDPSVIKAFRGFLIENGFYKADVTNASFASLAKAVKMHSIMKARAFLLKASTEIPSRADDIPIYVNPDKSLPPELRKWFEIKSDIPDEIKDVGKHLNIDGLNDVDAEAFGDLAEKVFPSKIGGINSEQVAASMIAGLTDPIENIRWVPAKLLYEGDMFANPKAFYTRGESWGALETVGKGFDIINDFMKMSVLQLNPAHIPMNLMGNLALNLMQQGPFAIMNLPRAAFLSRELSPDLAATVDLFMGRGISHVATTKKMLTHPSGVLADITGALVDKIPRRAAFLHEAWAKGYRTADDIEYLLTADQAADDLYEVTQRANDAIIDYERLSPFERKIMARTFFIYPWIKGATRYTFRFPLEHPIQAQAFALLYERQQSAADEKLGDRPWYAEFNMPIGEVTRFGREYPLVVNPKQLLPFTTPLEFAQAFGGYVLGKEEWPALLDTLQQFYPALATSLTGWDAFEQKEVPTGAMTFLKETLDMPLVNAWQRFDQTDEEREEAASNRMYPRNETDDILRTALGSLAPTPYNPEKGQRIAAGKKGKTPERAAEEKKKEIEGFYDPSLEPQVDAALASKVEFEHAKDEMRKRLKTEDLSDTQMVEALLEVAVKRFPGEIDQAYVLSSLNAVSSGRIKGALEKKLGWNILDAATGAANRQKRIDEARAEGAVVSAG